MSTKPSTLQPKPQPTKPTLFGGKYTIPSKN